VGLDAIFFVTVCGASRGQNLFCNSTAAPEIIQSIRNYHEQRRWFCQLALLMPDHIHLLLNLGPTSNLAETIGSWKRWIARSQHIAWQQNFFDHRLRQGESFQQKADYILHNPVRAGLVAKPEDWPYAWHP
jgi:REP element-mobilizing transposase RayT